MKKPMQTGDVAKALNMSDDNVRILERKGILTAQRTTSGNRLFDSDEVKRVKAERAKKGR